MRRCRQSVGLRSKGKAAARALELATACIGAWLVAATPALAQGSDARIVIDADRPGAKIDPNIYDRGSLTLSVVNLDPNRDVRIRTDVHGFVARRGTARVITAPAKSVLVVELQK